MKKNTGLEHQARLETARERKSSILEYLALIVAIASAIFAFWQAREANKSRIDAEQIAELGGRAYVGFADLSMPDKNNSRLYKFELRNAGTTPARHVEVYAGCDTGGAFDPGLEPKSTQVLQESGVMIPGASITVDYLCSPEKGPEPPKILANPPKEPREQNALENLEQIVMVGWVSYDDVQGKKHHTRFCDKVFHGKDGYVSIQQCAKGNDAT
jgi:hypothetical protein